MAYPQGAVVIATDPFESQPDRPYLVLSNAQHPFSTQECITAIVTTTARDDAIELVDSAFAQGSLPRQSYVSPWHPVTLKQHMIRKHVATVVESVVTDTVAELNTYLDTP